MKIILHAHKDYEIRNQLKELIENAFPQGIVILTDTRQQLAETLGRPLHNVSVLIAFISDSEDVGILASLKPLFEDRRLILVFCKRSDGIQKYALRLEPLYTSYFENNFQDVISVLLRIEQKLSHRPSRQKHNKKQFPGNKNANGSCFQESPHPAKDSNQHNY